LREIMFRIQWLIAFSLLHPFGNEEFQYRSERRKIIIGDEARQFQLVLVEKIFFQDFFYIFEADMAQAIEIGTVINHNTIDYSMIKRDRNQRAGGDIAIGDI